MKTNRRNFLKTLGGVAAFAIVPRHALGNGFIAPSDQLTRGIIGTGGTGRGHVDYAGTRLVAVCDVDKNHLEPDEQLVKDEIAAYHDFRDLVLDPNVDIIHVVTPPHWHGTMSVEIAKAGKDTWCEKPMTHTIGEGRRVMEAVKQYGRMLRLNTWFRSAGPFYGLGTPVKPLKKLAQSGMLGWPLGVTISKYTGLDWKLYWVGKEYLEPQSVPSELDYDFWLGPTPYKLYNLHRVYQTLRGYWDYDGGGLGDMEQHYIDPVQYLLGKNNTNPAKVEMDAPQQHPDIMGTWRSIIYTYEDGCQTVLWGSNYGGPNTSYISGPNGNVYKNFVCGIPDRERELSDYLEPEPRVTDFIERVKTRQPFALNERNGFRSATIVNMGAVALRLDRTLHFNPVELEFINDEAANRLLDQPMRTPWNI